MTKLRMHAPTFFACIAAMSFLLAITSMPMTALADGPPPGGNGVTCHNWNAEGQRQCDPNECYTNPVIVCHVTLCRSFMFLPCKACTCKPFTWPGGTQSCECQDT